MDRRSFVGRGLAVGLGSLGAVGLTAGCLEGQASEGDWDVGMTTTAFEPREIQVEPDTTVVWANSSTRNHTVTAYDDGIPEGADYFATGGFENEAAAREGFIDGEGVLRPDETFEHTFTVPGTYAYVCIPHERAGMVGTVVVGNAGTPDE
jgi:plastocyanin